MKLLGIHHITGIAGDPQTNLDFYTQVLGLRFVKRTVNFDDPGSYHFYFGDRTGRPGTALTFFPWPGARRGSRGVGQVVATSFAIPNGSLEFWKAWLKEFRVPAEETKPRFDQAVLRFPDPDGLLLELIASSETNEVDLDYKNPVPNEFAVRGFAPPTLEVKQAAKTEKLLTGTFGFTPGPEEPGRRRYSLGGFPSAHVDLLDRPEGDFGNVAVGSIHHIAFRAKDEAEQEHWREKISAHGLHVTPVIDRQYFHSIYFREPNGVLFEIATEAPGFTADEPVETLGEHLKLPPQYEVHRNSIERALPPIQLH